MLHGYYMDEGVQGMFRADGELVPYSGRMWVHNQEQFVSVIKCTLAAHPEWIA